MTLRTSIQRLIDSSCPDSPTDVIFLFGSLVMIALWIYATFSKSTVPQLTEVIGFLVLCKGVKMAGSFGKGGANVSDTSTSVGQP